MPTTTYDLYCYLMFFLNYIFHLEGTKVIRNVILDEP